MPGLDKHKLEDLEELGEGLAIHLTESELNEKPISVLELTMTDSEVSKHPMENKEFCLKKLFPSHLDTRLQ